MQDFFKKKKKGCGTTTLITSSEEMNDVMKIVQALEDSNILLKELLQQLKMKQKNKRMIFRNFIRYFRS